jgi:hypothetical protein
MKKQDKTFAQRAKEITLKYKRASWDAIEKKELEAELGMLSQEQEAFKAANGIGVNPQDGIPKFHGFGSSWIDGVDYNEDTLQPMIREKQPDVPLNARLTPKTINTTAVPAINPNSLSGSYNPLGLKLSQTGLQGGMPRQIAEPNYKPYETSVLPSVVSGATSLVGNLLLAGQAGKYTRMKGSRVAPEQISLANERQRITQEGAVAGSTIRTNARTAARTRGEYMGNVGQGAVGLNKNVSDALSRSYQTEAMQNAQARQRASEVNAQMEGYANQYNANMANRAFENKQAYQSAAMESIPQTFGNITQSQQFDALMNSRGGDYPIAMMPNAGRRKGQFWKPKNTPRVVYKKK